MQKSQQIIRLPSEDGYGEYDRYVLIPAGADPKAAVQKINDIIYAVNLEDNEHDGECLDGQSVEENIERQVVELGFTFLRCFETTNSWDSYDPSYSPSDK